jgi:copper chaperone CopZ
MKRCTALFASLFLFTPFASAADKPAASSQTATLTFFITGMECSACTYSVIEAVNSVNSVTEVQPDELGVLNISFDPRAASVHQIAQAVANALPLHGKPYEATLRFFVPDYAKSGNSAKVDDVFAKQKEWAKVEVVDRDKGEFVVRFLPLKADKTKQGPQGWNLGDFNRAVHDPAPKGLGLEITLVKQGQADAAGK